MAYLKSISVLFAFLFLSSCADYLPGTGILAPASVAGYTMDASGLEGSYTYRFAEDGSYVFTKIGLSNKKSATRKGTWEWSRKSPKSAELTLDRDLLVTLEFTTRHHANATIPGSDRLFAVDFEKTEE